MTRQARGWMMTPKRHKKSGAVLSVNVRGEDVRRICQIFPPGQLVRISIAPEEREEESAVLFIRQAAVKIAAVTGETTRQVKQRLQEHYGTKKPGVYLILKDGQELDSGSYVARREWAGALREGWNAYAVMKDFKDYRGDDLRRILRGLNEMLSEAGIPQAERLSDRLIEFYIDKREESEGDV